MSGWAICIAKAGRDYVTFIGPHFVSGGKRAADRRACFCRRLAKRGRTDGRAAQVAKCMGFQTQHGTARTSAPNGTINFNATT